MKTNLTTTEQISLIRRGTSAIISEEELARKIEISKAEKRPLRIKLGLDPTAPDIHLGTAVVLRKLRLFQELGNEVILVIGDFTATIGDPSGKSKTRPQLTPEEVRENAKTYEEQLYRIIDADKTNIVFNSEWLAKITFSDLLDLASRLTVARILERDDFKKRLDQNRPIGMHELLYPICQGYDSVLLKADLEIGGTDQRFNNLMGRELQRTHGQEAQVVLLMPLLVGLDGREKMSKSLGNQVGIRDAPDEMYGKLMSLPDELMIDYFLLTTDLELREIELMKSELEAKSINPKTLKQRLAREVVSIYHSATIARNAEREFDRIHAKKLLPKKIEKKEIAGELCNDGKIWIVRLLVEIGFSPSASEARRLIKQRGVRINGEPISDHNFELDLQKRSVLQVGKRKFAEVEIAR